MQESFLQLAHQRQDLALERVNAQGPDLLVANDARSVDDKRFRHAVNAVVDADASVLVDDGRRIGIAILRKPGASVVRLVLVVETVDGNEIRLRELQQQGMLLAARDAPRRPHVEKPYLALELRGGKRLVAVDLWQRE